MSQRGLPECECSFATYLAEMRRQRRPQGRETRCFLCGSKWEIEELEGGLCPECRRTECTSAIRR